MNNTLLDRFNAIWQKQENYLKNNYFNKWNEYIDNSVDTIEFEYFQPQLLEKYGRKENYTFLLKKAVEKNINLLASIKPEYLTDKKIYFDLFTKYIPKNNDLLNKNIFSYVDIIFLDDPKKYLKLAKLAVNNKNLSIENFSYINPYALPKENNIKNYFELFLTAKENHNLYFNYSLITNEKNQFIFKFDFNNHLDCINFDFLYKNATNLFEINDKLQFILENDKKEIIKYINENINIKFSEDNKLIFNTKNDKNFKQDINNCITDKFLKLNSNEINNKNIFSFEYQYNFINKLHPKNKKLANSIIEQNKIEIQQALNNKWQNALNQKFLQKNQLNSENFKLE